MGTTITFRRGENDPTSGSGLTLAEPAFNTTLKTFHIGLGHGITAAWVGAPISGLSADIAAGITYKIPSAAAVKNYIGGLCYGNTGAPTITQYVSSFNGLTGAVGGVCAAQANTFTALQGFSQGIVVDSGLTAYEIFVNGGVIRNTAGPLEVSSTFSTQSGIAFDVYGNSTITSNNNTLVTFNENSISADVPVVADYGLTASTLDVTGNAVIAGNLTVSGGVTFTISENVLIEDNIITLNSNVTGSPSENAGIEIERGTSANVQLLWNESSDKWTFTNDGSTYYDLPTSVVRTVNGYSGGITLGGLGITVVSTASGITLENDWGVIDNALIDDGTVIAYSYDSNSHIYTTAVNSFNGNYGAVQGVSSAAAGTGISVSAATGAVTITNTGVQSFNGNTGAVQGVSSVNGATGAVTNVAKTNEPTNFSAASNYLTVTDTTSGDTITINPSTNKIVFYDDNSGNDVQLYVGSFGNQVIAFPDSTCTLAGLDISQTFTSNNTFTGLTNFSAGISAAGGVTFAGDIAVNGGDITTTATTATVFNSTATTLSVGGANNATVNIGNGTGVTLNIGTGSLFGGVKNINIGSNGSFGTSNIAIGNSIGNVTITASSSSGGITLSAQTVRVAGAHTISGAGTVEGLLTANSGLSAAGSTFASTTNTLDVIASTEGAGLRIARATSGVGSRIGGIRLGRSATSSLNTYIEGSSGTFSLYNGVDNTGTQFASFSPTLLSLGTTSASFITLNSPNTISFGDQSSVGNNQAFSMSGTARTYTFGDSNGVTAGFVGINRSGLCADYALEVNSPTGKGLQLIYNDHTGAASNWVNMDVSSGGNFTVRPSGGLATVTGTLNVSAGVCAAGITLSANGKIQADGGVLYIGNNPDSTTRVIIGDFDASGNSTYIHVRDNASALDIINPNGPVRIGDPDGINNGAHFTVENGNGTAEISASEVTVNGLLKPSSGISASGGVTFGGTVASDTGYRITSNAINAQTGTTYTFLSSDNGKIVTFNNASAVTVTIPTALPVGFNCTAIQLGTGQVGFTAASGVTMQSYGSQYRLIGQHAAASIIEYSANIVNLSGNLVV